jgi:hypothetical protein
MAKLWSGFTRVYFNAFEEAPNFWSLDQGVGTPEIKVERVTMRSSELSTVVIAGSKVQPRAWLEGDVVVSQDANGWVVLEDVHDMPMRLPEMAGLLAAAD